MTPTINQTILKHYKNLNLFNGIYKLLSSSKEKIIKTSKLFGSSKALLLLDLIEKENQIILLAPGQQQVNEYEVELRLLGLEEYLVVIDELSPLLLQERLTGLSVKEKFILITTYQILETKLPAKEILHENTTTLQTGTSLGYNDLVEYLNLIHYQKEKFVESPGDYSQRGSIIDFWSYSEKMPVRVEYDGDFIESIRYFDPESQRSTGSISTASIAASMNAMEGKNENLGDSLIFDYLVDPLFITVRVELNGVEWNEIKPFEDNHEEVLVSAAENIYDDEFPEVPISEILDEVKTENKNLETIDKIINSSNGRWLIEENFFNDESILKLGITEPPSIHSNYERLFNVITQYASSDNKIYITTDNEFQSKRLIDLLSDYKKELSELLERGIVKVVSLPLKEGFYLKEEKLLTLTDYQIFNKPYRTKLPFKKKKRSSNKEIASINIGDYVVHEDYGIAKYAGLETIKIGETNQESMKLLYNDGGIVYVNLNYLHLVKKYSAKEGVKPNLATLGSAEWVNTKKRTKRRIKEAARELILLYAKRKGAEGYAFSPDTVWQKELEASFIYEDTPDQSKVTEEVKVDMEALNPMDRLVCGDVGFGKTEIAVRASFKAVQDGKQVALLVPTTILAEQHFNTFKDRLSQFPVKIAALSRFQTKSAQKEVVKDLSEGKVDIVIGTHRIISNDVKFKELGLLIIDEEHRFGVMAKEKLRSFKLNVDTLTLSATPIPRTLNLSLLGARDLSIIATPPPNRQSINTKVEVFDILKMRDWILTELNRSGQVYIIHDRIQSIDKFAAYIQKYLPQVRLAIAHGQMKPAQLEDVFHGFMNRQFDILISTKIIESGIDIPNVNTIIINRADRFGLAELHQLRGRVGRSDRQAYAYFIVPSMNSLQKNTVRRLQAIEEFTELGVGFNLAMRDLEIRGAGNLLGTAQSGFINEVGFDLYLKLINEAVEELKYEEFKDVFNKLPKHEERTDPQIDTYFEIGIPKTYIPDQMDRLSFYTTLYSISILTQLEDIREELKDRFGALPVTVERLLLSATLRLYASRALFERLIIQRKNIMLILPQGAKEDYYKYKFMEMMRYITDNYKENIKLNQQKESLKLVMENRFDTPERMLKFLIKFSREISELFGVKLEEAVVQTVN
jgi:transcription-repair coupling factor (superfamily II helicase)